MTRLQSKKAMVTQIKRELYSFDYYGSMDVYRAALDLGMTSADERFGNIENNKTTRRRNFH